MRTMVQFTIGSNRQLPEKFRTFQPEIVKKEPVDEDDRDNKHENNFHPVKMEYYSDSGSELDLDWDEKYNIYGVNPENIDVSCNLIAPKLCNPTVLLKRLPESILTKFSRPKDIELITRNLCTEIESEHIQAGAQVEDATAAVNNLSKCSRCTKQFKDQLRLRHHLLYCGKLPHLQCSHCAYKTKYKSALKSHTLLKHSTKKTTGKKSIYCGKNGLRCKQCSFATNHKTSLYKHMKNVHSNNLQACCPKCYKKFKYKKALERHVIYCQENLDLQSSQCSRITEKRNYLKKPIILKKADDKVVNVSTCSKCNKKFKYKKSLEKHLNHCEESMNHRVNQCLSNTIRKDLVKSHTTLEKFEACIKCDKKFKQRQSLKKHSTYCGKNSNLQSKNCPVETKHPSDLAHNAKKYQKGYANHKKRLKKQSNLKFHPHHPGCLQACRKCGKWYANKQSLKSHLHYCGKERNLQCDQCSYKTCRKADLKKHKTSVHLEKDINYFLACFKCGNRYKNQQSLTRHLRYCGEEPHLQCDYCPYKTNIKASLKDHIFCLHLEKDLNYFLPCSKCGKTYKHQSSLASHIKLCGREPHLQCDYCSYKTKLKGSLKRHIFRAHLDTDVNEFLPCSRCGKIFKHQQALTRHLSYCGEPPRFQCDYCTYKTRLKQSLAKHILLVHLEKGVNYSLPCSKCGKRYKNKHTLTRHLYLCGRKPHLQCDDCSYKTNSKSSLRSHILLAHLEKDVNNYLPCSKCGKRYKNRQSLTRHSYDCGQEARFKCDYCSYKTHVKRNLANHILLVHLEKDVNNSLSCSKCGKIYKNQHSLNGHLALCGKEPNLQCDYCSHKTQIKNSLQKHILAVHLEKDINYSLPCSKCGKRYKNKPTLTQHLYSCGLKSHFQCDHCSYKTNNKTSLKNHILRIHVEKDVNHFLPCSKCGKRYKNQLSLSRHLGLCGKEPHLNCDYCSYKTYMKSSLKIHILRNHLQKDPNNFSSCSKSGKKYKNQQSLTQHFDLCRRKPRRSNTRSATRKDEKSKNSRD